MISSYIGVYNHIFEIFIVVGKLPASQANAEVVSAFRREENERAKKLFDYYLIICRRAKVCYLPDQISVHVGEWYFNFAWKVILMSLNCKRGHYSSWSTSAVKKCSFAFDPAVKLFLRIFFFNFIATWFSCLTFMNLHVE